MYRTNIDNTCAIDIDSQSIQFEGFEKIEKRVSCFDKVKESRSGGGNGIDKEVDRSGGGRGDE
jgi:hypothetical protein